MANLVDSIDYFESPLTEVLHIIDLKIMAFSCSKGMFIEWVVVPILRTLLKLVVKLFLEGVVVFLVLTFVTVLKYVIYIYLYHLFILHV